MDARDVIIKSQNDVRAWPMTVILKTKYLHEVS